MYGNRSISYGGYYLTQNFSSNVAYGIHALYVSFSRFVRNNVPVAI
jgi:hypothetical protein